MVKRSKRVTAPKTSKKRKTSKKLAKSVKRIVKSLSETKCLGTSVREQAVISNTTGYVDTSISKLAQGDGPSEYIGKKFNPVGINIRYLLHNNSTVDQFVRVVFALATEDKFAINPPDATTEWRMDVNGQGQALVASRIDDVFAPLNTSELKIIYDKTHFVSGSTNASTPSAIYRKAYRKLSGTRKTENFLAADTPKGNVRMLVLNRRADNDPATGETIEVTYETRYYFKDF